jgi:hypothetical protein
MRREDATDEPGVWVRLTLDIGGSMTGFAPGADSPNDFWTVFKTQLVRLEHAIHVRSDGTRRRYDTIYVNRDRILLADVATDLTGDSFHEEALDA